MCIYCSELRIIISESYNAIFFQHNFNIDISMYHSIMNKNIVIIRNIEIFVCKIDLYVYVLSCSVLVLLVNVKDPSF